MPFLQFWNALLRKTIVPQLTGHSKHSLLFLQRLKTGISSGSWCILSARKPLSPLSSSGNSSNSDNCGTTSGLSAHVSTCCRNFASLMWIYESCCAFSCACMFEKWRLLSIRSADFQMAQSCLLTPYNFKPSENQSTKVADISKTWNKENTRTVSVKLRDMRT